MRRRKLISQIRPSSSLEESRPRRRKLINEFIIVNAALVRRLILPLHERLLGRPTLARAAELERTQWHTTKELRALQIEKLRRLISHAAERCPYYRDVIRDTAIEPSFMTLDELARLPTLSKDDIRRNGPRLLASPFVGRLFDYSTGGSSGDPLLFKIDRSRQSADQSARIRSRRWFGVEPGERELYLWGAAVELAAQDRLKQLRDRLTNHRLLSAFEMTPDRMTRYLCEIEQFDPVHVFGYPSSLARLARHARTIGSRLRGPSLKAVFVTGELLDPRDRAVIESMFAVPVADGYGAREAGFIAHQCPQGRYHVTMESLIVELLNERGRPAADGESGEVTITHLDAFGMPFIRYRTGDLARRSIEPCPCGRGLETLEGLRGRRTDMLRTVDGGEAHALSAIYVLREERGVRQFRVEQLENLDLIVSVVVETPFDDASKRRIVHGLRRRIGDVQVELRIVDHIPVDPSGKHRCVASRATSKALNSDEMPEPQCETR